MSRVFLYIIYVFSIIVIIVMKKIVLAAGIICVLGSCKTSKHKCDAYSSVEEVGEYDISKISTDSQKKYSSYCIIKN